MNRATPLACLALLLGACDTGSTDELDAALDAAPAEADADVEPDAEPAPAFCEGAVAQRYAPFEADELELFPDDLLTRPDPQSPTGLRLDLSVAAWSEALPRPMRSIAEDMTALSGFGHNGAIVVRFTGPIAPWDGTVDGSLTDTRLMLFDLDADPPARVPFSVIASDGDTAIIVQPERPLRGGARHGLLADVDDADGGCVAPSPTLQAVLTDSADDPRLAALAPIYADLLAAAGREPTSVSAATVFTAHDDTGTLHAIADGLADRPAEWVQRPVCQDGDIRRCDGTVRVWDYRDTDGGPSGAVLTAEPNAPWELAVTFRLPPAGGRLPPLVFMGHGLNSSRGEIDRVARFWTPEGIAAVAMDAVGHGDHPTTPDDDDPIARVTAFLGLDLSNLMLDSRRLTGNFDQSALDRLQLLDLLRREPDIDGDGRLDFDPERMGYYGISLGGLMGPALLALDPALELGVLQVPGGRLATFATRSAPVEQFEPIIINLFGSRARFERLLPVLQAAVDRADPATWAPRVMQRPGGPPHLLMQMCTFDEIVPPETGVALARAFDLPHVGEVIEPVPLLTLEATPTRLNLPGGSTSGGFTQFDRVGNDASPRPSDHDSTPDSAQAHHQVEAFILPWRDGATPEIVDPYGERDTAPLP